MAMALDRPMLALLLSLALLQLRSACAQTSCPASTPTFCAATTLVGKTSPGCYNTSVDTRACGGCEVSCPRYQPCEAGLCQCPPKTPTYCNANTTIGKAYYPGCYNTTVDANACGGCEVRCPRSQPCVAGKCQCPATTPTYCDTNTTTGKIYYPGCYNTTKDTNACGSCGTICPKYQPCFEGKCQCPRNKPTYCNANTTTGKEYYPGCYDIRLDANACGGCNVICPKGQPCFAGKCQCPTSAPTYCAASSAAGKSSEAGCFDTATNRVACGSCNSQCLTGEVCVRGVCGRPASPSTKASPSPSPRLSPASPPGIVRSGRGGGSLSGADRLPASDISFDGGVPICFPASLAINANGEAAPASNGVLLFPACATLAPPPSSPGLEPPSENDTDNTPWPSIFPTSTRAASSAEGGPVQVYHIPLNIFSLNENRDASKAGAAWEIGPLIKDDPRVLVLLNLLQDKCPPSDGVAQSTVQSALWNITSQKDLDAAFASIELAQLQRLPRLADNCAAVAEGLAQTPNVATASNSGSPRNFSSALLNSTGVGGEAGAVFGYPYKFFPGVNVTAIRAQSPTSGCPATAKAIGSGGQLQLCVEVELSSPMSFDFADFNTTDDDLSVPISNRRRSLQQAPGESATQFCNVEITLRAFLPPEVVYSPDPFSSQDEAASCPAPSPTSGRPIFCELTPAAFSGDGHGFGYDFRSSRVEISGNFTMEDDDLSDISSLGLGAGSWNESLRYSISDTAPASTTPWRGALTARDPRVLAAGTLPRTVKNLHMFGQAHPAGSVGYLNFHVDGGLLLHKLAPTLNADILVTFVAIPAGDGVAYTYYYEVSGLHDGFPAFELFINQVPAYQYTPEVARFYGPLGLYYLSTSPLDKNLGFQQVPGCSAAIECNSGNKPLASQEGGQSPVTDVRIIPVAGVQQVRLEYEAYENPDRFRIQNPADGTILYDTGFVGLPDICPNIQALRSNLAGKGQGVAVVTVPPGATTLAVLTDSPCRGTEWVYKVLCS